MISVGQIVCLRACEGTVDSHNKKGPRGVEEENDEQEETNEGRIVAEDGTHSGKKLAATPFQKLGYPDSECPVLWELDEW